MFALFSAEHFVHLLFRCFHLQHVRKRYEPDRRLLEGDI